MTRLGPRPAHRVSPSEFNVVTTYARIFFDWSPLTVYRLLQGKVYYEGGLKIYVNGHEVARFNLEEGATASTYALQHHDYDSPSRFHLSMLLDNCLTAAICSPSRCIDHEKSPRRPIDSFDSTA